MFPPGQRCLVCDALATDLHEAFINKGAVQGASEDVKAQINHPYNCVPLCGLHNQEITHETQVVARRWLCNKAATKHYDGMSIGMDERDLLHAGAEIIQGWVDGLGLKTPYRVKGMAEL